ncbi:MAG: chemotaxis protein CheW [Candidatus Obscuribacterales bacterium]|nr:chemotaxis protein CheW [Candidatus Obscuribacterales bacterium]
MSDDPSASLNRVLTQKILKARARKLARPIIEEGKRDLAYRLVLVSIGGGRFGFETKFVDEVLRLRSITDVPGLNLPFVGVSNVRGDLVTVIQPTALLQDSAPTAMQSPVASLPSRRKTDFTNFLDGRSHAVLLRGEERLALLVDDLLGVRDVDASELTVDYSGLSSRLASFVVSVTREYLIILDSEKIISAVARFSPQIS